MKLDPVQLKILKWAARIIALVMIVFGLPFYFGYGNPLPFASQEYSLLDNIWLSLFPLMFIGLVLGWKYEKTGGYLVTISLVLGFMLVLTAHKQMSVHMCIPFMVGIFYLIVGYDKNN